LHKLYGMKKSILVLALITVLGATLIYARPFNGHPERNDAKETVSKKAGKTVHTVNFKADREKLKADKKSGASKQTLHADRKELVQDKISLAREHQHYRKERREQNHSATQNGAKVAQPSANDQQ